MKRSLLLLVVVFAMVLAACAGPAGDAGPAGPAGPQGPAGPAGPAGVAGDTAAATVGADYVGTQTCAGCHPDNAEEFLKSGHPYKLNKVVDGQPPTYPFTEVTEVPEGYTWDDVTYVIGGYNWKARFIGLDGYIITGAAVQYNFPNADNGLGDNWVAYHDGEQKPYDCGPCHTTGYNPEGHQDGLEGIIGTWAAPGIQCEECHGPGSNHVSDPYGVAMKVDASAESCTSCHYRGSKEDIDASGGFIKHHEQGEELLQTKHEALNCVTCHDPHSGVIALRKEAPDELAARFACETCHEDEARHQKSTVMAGFVDCIDCHMPRIVKSAVGDADAWTGDIRTHLFKIDPDLESQFSEDGSTAHSAITLGWACKSCHRDGGSATVKTDEELKATAEGYHAEG